MLLYGQSQEIDSRNEQKLSEDKLPKIKKQLTEKKNFEPPLGVSENRDKLISFLKKIQEAGINTNQHSLKPQMYSGLWLNDVSSAGALHREIAKLTPSEAVLQIFNVLFPYPKSLPPPVPDTSDFQSFFGLSESNIPDFADFRPEPTLKIQDDSKLLKLQQLLQVSDSKVFDLQQAIVSKDQRIQALQIIIEEKTEEMASAQKIIQETREKFQDMSKLIPNQDEIKKIKAEKENLLRQLDQANTKYIEKEQEYNVSKAQIEELKNDVKSMPSKSEVEELKIHIEKLKADDRALRFIAGQVLIKGIDNKETKDPASAETHLQDNEILIRLETSLKNNRPSLKQRLIDVDANKDDKVSKAEVTKVLSNLALVPQDIVAFLRIAGFRAGVSAVPITDIINLLSNRENNMQNLENQLFGKLSDHFKKGALNIEQAFQFLDLNGDGKINFQELSDTLDTINLPLSREDRHALFAVLDSDHNGSISLEEFKQRIETAKPLPPKPAILPKREETKIENSKGLVKNELKEPVEETPVKLSEKKIVKKISGSLVIGIVKGKALGQGNLAAQLTLKGSERVLKTPFLPGPDPDWKFKSTVKLFDTSTAQVDTEIYLELLGDRGLIASCKVPWLPTLDFPNSWAVKTDFPLLEPNNRKHGSVIVHLMWVPKEALRVEGGGNLTLQLLSFSGFGSSHIQLAVNTQNVMGLMKQAEQLTVKNIYLKPDEPIPSLKFTIFTADTRQMVL